MLDLLNNKNRLEIREDQENSINIVGLCEYYAASLDEFLKIIKFGIRQITNGKDYTHSEYSRSHGIIQIRIINEHNMEHGKITFLDITGTEMEVDNTHNIMSQKIKIDGAEINNLSLTLLESKSVLDIEKMLTPFRRYKLPIILRDSFIDDNKILIIANISPGNNSFDQTLRT